MRERERNENVPNFGIFSCDTMRLGTITPLYLGELTARGSLKDRKTRF
jgi:hypothetical protein